MAVLVGRVSPETQQQAQGWGIVARTGPVERRGLPGIHIKAWVSLEESLGSHQPSCRQVPPEASLSALPAGSRGHGTLGLRKKWEMAAAAVWGTTSVRRERRTSHHQREDAEDREKTAALRPSGSGGLQQRAEGVGAGGWEPSGTLVAFETASSLVTKMASQSQGIQQLLQAEKRAAEKVADARKRKARRLKQAKEEAQMEVEQYRREREQEFQSKQQAAMGSQGNLSAEVEQATRRQVQGMQSSQQRNRERVLAQLLGMVCDVRPQVHPNYRITV